MQVILPTIRYIFYPKKNIALYRIVIKLKKIRIWDINTNIIMIIITK